MTEPLTVSQWRELEIAIERFDGSCQRLEELDKKVRVAENRLEHDEQALIRLLRDHDIVFANYQGRRYRRDRARGTEYILRTEVVGQAVNLEDPAILPLDFTPPSANS